MNNDKQFTKQTGFPSNGGVLIVASGNRCGKSMIQEYESTISAQQERIAKLEAALKVIYSNAAESPEWIRARIDTIG